LGHGKKIQGHIVYPLIRRGDAVLVVPGKVGEFARVFGGCDITKRAKAAYPRRVWCPDH